MNRPTIWIDVTDMVSWRGNFTGIQRTVYNLAKGLAGRDDVRFFKLNNSRSGFEAADFDEVEETRQRPVDEELADKSLTQYMKWAAGLARLGALKARRAVPLPLRQALKRAIKQRGLLAAEIHLPSPFAERDVVLVLGGNWGDDFLPYMSLLSTVRQRRHLRLYHLIYDLIPIKFPNYYMPGSTLSYRRYLDQLLKCADGLIAISESTRKDLEQYMDGLKLERRPELAVFRLGEDFAYPQEAATTPRKKWAAQLTDQFILSVGTVEPRKNHLLLYYVAKEALRQGLELPPIVIAGRRSWMTSDIQHMIDHDPETKQRLFIIDNVTDAELAWLYQHCRLSVYPSFYEGWGLPLAESLHYGKLCLSSDASSMPEVAGDLVEYFSPYDAMACLNLIQRYMDDETLQRRETEVRARQRAFTWTDSLEQLEGIVGSWQSGDVAQ